MMRFGLLAATLLLASCQPMPQQAGAAPTQEPSWEIDTTDIPPPVRVPETVADADACRAQGGELRLIGRMQTPSCVVRYADAGKRCTDGSQCQGDCRAETDLTPPGGSPVPGRTPAGPAVVEGRCQADSNPFGCYTRLENGRGVTLCVD